MVTCRIDDVIRSAGDFVITIVNTETEKKLVLSYGIASIRSHSYANETALNNAISAITTAIKAGYVDFDSLFEPDFTIAPLTAAFDKENPDDIEFVLTNAQSDNLSVANGDTTLTVTTDYTFADGVLTILDDYLATVDNGNCELTVTEEGTSQKVVIAVTGLEVSPAEAEFDKEEPADLVFTATGGTVTGVKNGDSELTSDDFTVTGNETTVNKEYLATLSNGTVTLKLCTAYEEIAVTVTVSGVAVAPLTATFDKAAPEDVVFTATGGTVTGVKNGENDLTAEDFTVEDGTVTIKKEYLATLENGDVTLKVCTAYEQITVTVTVSGTAEE